MIEVAEADATALRELTGRMFGGQQFAGPLFKIRHAYFGKFCIDGPGGMTFWKVPAGPGCKAVPWDSKDEAQAALDILES
tara:strand:- start:2351 stop:2590 length:240 start_codon:yes stop_codon:yes gene_type:complete